MNERIRELRIEKGLTLEEFGDKLGITKSGVSKIENGERNITNQVFLAICREFNVNPLWLEKGIGPMFLLPIQHTEYNDAVKILETDQDFVSCTLAYVNLPQEHRQEVIKYIMAILQASTED